MPLSHEKRNTTNRDGYREYRSAPNIFCQGWTFCPPALDDQR